MMLDLNTLHKRWLPSLIFSPFGRDKREGAGCENPFSNSLLNLGLLRIVWTTFQYFVAEGPLAQGSYEFSWIRQLGTNQRCEDVGGGGHIPLARRDRRVRNSVSALPYGRVPYLQIPSLRWVCRLVVRHGQLYREMETAEISCPGCGSVRQKTLLWT